MRFLTSFSLGQVSLGLISYLGVPAALGNWPVAAAAGMSGGSTYIDARMGMTIPPHLNGFPVTVEIPVQWAEMDVYGHVNNAVFFRYFENARVEYLARCGFLDSFDVEQVGAILHSTACRFRGRLVHPDAVLVGAKASDVGDDRFTMEYVAVSMATGEVVAEGNAVIVSFDYAAQRKAPLPDFVRDRIHQLERRAGGMH